MNKTMGQDKRELIVSLRVTPLYVVENDERDRNNSITADLSERGEMTDEGE